MHRRRLAFLLSFALAMVGLMASTAWAATTVGRWQFDEGSGARTAYDSSGYGQHGTVGADVRTGRKDGGRTFYRFPTDQPGVVNRDHLVVVGDRARLDPGSTGRFAVTIRFRTSTSHDNIAQKGQGGTAGGYWKVELAKGLVRCTFKDGAGRSGVIASKQRVDDGRWHTVTCARTPTAVSVVLDGVRRNRSVTTGSIANGWEMAVGGKSRCSSTVSCDYFTGDVDSVVITRG